MLELGLDVEKNRMSSHLFPFFPSRKRRRRRRSALQLGSIHSKQEIVQVRVNSQETISVDDYHSRYKEFSSWLVSSKGIYFNDLMADESRRLFKEFVKAWNAGKVPINVVAAGETSHVQRGSKYKWKFRNSAKQSSASGAHDQEDDYEAFRKQRKKMKKM